jgi:hypothetical protein
MRDMAATVSVAQRTLLIIIISVNVSIWKNISLMKIIKAVRHKNPKTVPSMPKKEIIPKF